MDTCVKDAAGHDESRIREAIGEEVGQFVVMDREEDGSAVGEFLRIKVKLDIRKSLMRGVTLLKEEGGKEKKMWCPILYGFLPDFCYICGIIGHTERACRLKEKRGGVQQYSAKLRFIPQKRNLLQKVSLLVVGGVVVEVYVGGMWINPGGKRWKT